MTIDRTIHMQAEPEAVDNTSWTGDETTIVSNQQSMLAVWDMAAWSKPIIAVIAPIASQCEVRILSNYFFLVALILMSFEKKANIAPNTSDCLTRDETGTRHSR